MCCYARLSLISTDSFHSSNLYFVLNSFWLGHRDDGSLSWPHKQWPRPSKLCYPTQVISKHLDWKDININTFFDSIMKERKVSLWIIIRIIKMCKQCSGSVTFQQLQSVEHNFGLKIYYIELQVLFCVRY